MFRVDECSKCRIIVRLTLALRVIGRVVNAQGWSERKKVRQYVQVRIMKLLVGGEIIGTSAITSITVVLALAKDIWALLESIASMP